MAGIPNNGRPYDESQNYNPLQLSVLSRSSLLQHVFRLQYQPRLHKYALVYSQHLLI